MAVVGRVLVGIGGGVRVAVDIRNPIRGVRNRSMYADSVASVRWQSVPRVRTRSVGGLALVYCWGSAAPAAERANWDGVLLWFWDFR